MFLYFVRHAEPIYELDCLTDLGRKQSSLVCKRLENISFKKIFCSPNGRAIQTGKPLMDKLGIEPIIVPKFSEDYSWAHWFAKTEQYEHCFLDANDEILQKIIGKDKCYTDINYGFNNGVYVDDEDAKKTWGEFGQMVDEFIESLGYKKLHGEGNSYEAINPSNDNYVLFSHSAIGRYFLSYLTNIAPHIFMGTFCYQYTGVTIIEFPNKKGKVFPRIITLSDIGHLNELKENKQNEIK